MRSLSQVAGATGTGGPGTISGGAIAAPSGGGGGGYSPVGQLESSGESIGIGLGAAYGTNLGILALGLDVGFGAAGPVGIAAAAIYDLYSFFSSIFGGDGPPPPPYQLRYGRHPLYDKIMAIEPELLPTQVSFMTDDGSDSDTIESDASWYTPTGKLTASGEPYTDPWAYTAAMPDWVVGPNAKYPYGTIATVTYTAPGSVKPVTVKVRVNDRLPTASAEKYGRVIDLSPGAFVALTGNLTAGKIHVRVTLSKGPKPPLSI